MFHLYLKNGFAFIILISLIICLKTYSLHNLSVSERMSGQHYCLRWNNYQSNMTSVFHQLLQNEAFVDVTLACNDLSLKAHKVSSNYNFSQFLLN